MGISKDDILNRTDGGLDVFKHFLAPHFPGINKAFKNPFYNDNKASCYVYREKKSGTYRLIDFGDSDYHLDCFSLIGQIFKLDCSNPGQFIQILEIINRELCLGKPKNANKIIEVKRRLPGIKTADEIESITISPLREDVSKTLIPPVLKEFTSAEMNYWHQYGITRTILDTFHVVSIKEFRGISNLGKEYHLYSSVSEPIFGYRGNRFLKVYRPNSNGRFYYAGDLHEGYCFGLTQLPLRGDILFITGGEKDVLSLAAKGFHAICFNSETVTIPKNLIRGLSFRFKHIVLMYDMDKTGIKAMDKQTNQLKEFGVKALALPLSGEKNQKDISDYFRLGNTSTDLLKLFSRLLDKIYEETISLLKSFEVDFKNPPEAPEPLVSINNVPIGSAGNLMAITGSEGSGKSNYLRGILAGTIVADKVDYESLGTEITRNKTGKAVLFYDTEQSEEQLYKNLKQIIRRSINENPPKWLKTYGLAGMSRKDRFLSIIHSMDRFYYKFGGIHMVVIDGIADLIDAVNDEEKAVALIDELFRLAGIYKTCIICVLHLSPSGYKLRGHLGSEIQRKAAGIISVEKDDNKTNSIIKALKVRDGSPLEIPQIIIGWDEEQKFHIYLGEKDTSTPAQRKINELSDIARDIFEHASALGYMALISELQERLGVKERQAKNYLKFMRENNIIGQNHSDSNLYSLKISPY